MTDARERNPDGDPFSEYRRLEAINQCCERYSRLRLALKASMKALSAGLPGRLKSMDSDRYDDPAIETGWLRGQRASVEAYLATQRVAHAGVPERPAWFVAPYFALWPVASLKRPSSTGWWVVSGDVPTDYVSSAEGERPREALQSFSRRWTDLAARMSRGEPHPTMQVGDRARAGELAPLLRSRATLLERFADDDGCWDA
jgi:hypothetical protein